MPQEYMKFLHGVQDPMFSLSKVTSRPVLFSIDVTDMPMGQYLADGLIRDQPVTSRLPVQ